MVSILALLVTIVANPSFCQAPCYVNTLSHLEQPLDRGWACVHLLPIELKDDDDHTKSCWNVEDEGGLRFKRIPFKGVGKGQYVIYFTLDGKMVSNKQTLNVSGGYSEEKLK